MIIKLNNIPRNYWFQVSTAQLMHHCSASFLCLLLLCHFIKMHKTIVLDLCVKMFGCPCHNVCKIQSATSHPRLLRRPTWRHLTSPIDLTDIFEGDAVAIECGGSWLMLMVLSNPISPNVSYFRILSCPVDAWKQIGGGGQLRRLWQWSYVYFIDNDGLQRGVKWWVKWWGLYHRWIEGTCWNWKVIIYLYPLESLQSCNIARSFQWQRGTFVCLFVCLFVCR